MPGTSPGMTSVALLLRRLSSFLPPLSPLLPRHSALLTPLVLGRLVQGIKPTQQVLTQPLGLGSLIPVFRLGAVERLAPGATGFHFLHGVEAVFQRGQVAARPLLLLDRREPAAYEIGAAEHVAATGASTQASPVAADAPRADAVCATQVPSMCCCVPFAPSDQARHRRA